MADHSCKALYYPFIHFKDDRWLKLSALYWDRMGRIVPREYTRKDSDTVRALGDFIENLHPGWVGPSFGRRFTEFVVQYGPRLREKYDVSRSAQWPVAAESRRPPKAGGPSGSDPRLSFVFYEKMPGDVRRVMLESQIARPDKQDPRWIGMHPTLADVYMTALADQLAGEYGLYPLTDEPMDHLSVGGSKLERLTQAALGDVDLVSADASETEIETATVFVAFESVVPADISSLPVERILAFREKYPTERARFQKRVASFIKAREWLNEIQQPKVLARHIQSEFDKEMKPELQELREKHREIGIETVQGVLAMQITVPLAVTQVAALLGVAANPIGSLVAGAALAAIPILRDRRKANRELKTSDVSYLMRVERDLRPRQVSDWIVEAARSFRIRRPRFHAAT